MKSNSSKDINNMTNSQDEIELLSNDKDPSRHDQFTPFKHFFSQYFWLLFISSFCYFGIKYIPYQDSGIIKSSTSTSKWNDDLDPIWFGHLTDIHLNSLDTKTNYRFFNAISALSNLSVDDLLITGDLVDNWGEKIFSKYGHQYVQDYIFYNESISKYLKNFKNVIDMAGNHDEFGIYNFNSKNHHYLDYSIFFTRQKYQKVDDFWASSFETPNFIFVLLNPYLYPAPHAKFDYFVRPTTEILDFVEKELDKHKNAQKPVIVACHYPMYFWLRTALSSQNKKFIDIIRDSNAAIFISGHIHPSVSVFEHHNGFLEVAAADIGEHSSYSLCVFDNSRVSFHTFRDLQFPKVILTHPIPVRQTSNRNVFDETNTAIRLLVFGNNSLNIKVRGAVEGTLKYQREIRPNVYLYSIPISLDTGYHTIEFYGDWDYSCDFYVGNQIQSFKERRYGSTNLFGTAIIYSIIFAIIIFFILYPGRLITDSLFHSCIGVPCFDAFFGFFSIRQRIRYLPMWLRIELFLSFLAPLVLPISFVDDEGHYGILCLYGYSFDWTFVYDIWGQLISMVYELCVVLVAALFASGMAVSEPWHPIFIIDGITAIVGFFFGIYFLNTAVMEASGPFLTNLSPLFILMPIILHFTILTSRLSAPGMFFRVWRSSKDISKKKVD
ncbi:Transmembrane protein 62 [Tritrichomonas musculus]|uniref:Transmembrane protein 62 n=1 Tax=Tritrichomonas musculus TaxID=1915356 RepID=A0ABR2KKI5_9EUKA